MLGGVHTGKRAGGKGNNDVVVVTEGLILWVRGHVYLLSKECLVAWLEIEVCC